MIGRASAAHLDSHWNFCPKRRKLRKSHSVWILISSIVKVVGQ